MGIFSDATVNEAAEIVKSEPASQIFLEYFHLGWKKERRENYSTQSTDASFYTFAEINQGLKPGMRKPKDFGYNFGRLIGMLESKPLIFLDAEPQAILEIISTLKKSNQGIYHMFKKNLEKCKSLLRSSFDKFDANKRNRFLQLDSAVL